MTAAGWYHGDGDPAGTVRYWDGYAWAGEPTMNAASNGVVFYAAPPQDQVFAGASATEQAVGGVAYKTTQREAPAVAGPPVPPAPTPAIPASAQLVAIALCVLKALGLVYVLLNVIWIALWGTLILEFQYNENIDKALEWAIGLTFGLVAIGASLLMAQALGAARTKPVLMLVPALLLTMIDGFFAYVAWSSGQGTGRFFYTGLVLLQAWVVVGAIIGMVKSTP